MIASAGTYGYLNRVRNLSVWPSVSRPEARMSRYLLCICSASRFTLLLRLLTYWAGARWSSSVAEVAVSRLVESGFYHGAICRTEARRLLQPHPPGTFLVRDSSDQRFLFSLTLRTAGEPTPLIHL